MFLKKIKFWSLSCRFPDPIWSPLLWRDCARGNSWWGRHRALPLWLADSGWSASTATQGQPQLQRQEGWAKGGNAATMKPQKPPSSPFYTISSFTLYYPLEPSLRGRSFPREGSMMFKWHACLHFSAYRKTVCSLLQTLRPVRRMPAIAKALSPAFASLNPWDPGSFSCDTASPKSFAFSKFPMTRVAGLKLIPGSEVALNQTFKIEDNSHRLSERHEKKYVLLSLRNSFWRILTEHLWWGMHHNDKCSCQVSNPPCAGLRHVMSTKEKAEQK